MEGEKSEGRKILVWNLFPPAVYKCSHKTRETLKIEWFDHDVTIYGLNLE